MTMVRVNKMTCICENHFCYYFALLLQTRLRKTQKQLQKIHKRSCTAFWKLMCVQTQRSSEEAFHFFGRNLPILRKSLLNCSRAALPTHFRKTVQMLALFVLSIPYNRQMNNIVEPA